MYTQKDLPRILNHLTRFDEFKGFTNEELIIFQNNMHFKKYHAGQVLFDQMDERNNFFFLLNGIVKTAQTNEQGELGYFTYIGPDKSFPFRGLFYDKYYSYIAEAVTDIEIVYFPMVTFETLLRRNNSMAIEVISKMGQIIDQNENRLEMMLMSNPSKRVENYLKILGEDLGNQVSDKRVYINMPITITQLADDCGTSRDTASFTIKRLISSKKITYQDRHITLNIKK